MKRIVPNISSNQFEISKQFYIDFLGLKLVMDMDWILTFASESNPTAQISIVKEEKIHTKNSDIMISIEISDVDIVYDKARSLGLKIIYPITNEPWGVRRFFVKDPNGATINLLSHVHI
ncbi:MAG: glyoxalase [Calditrichaeota bacterium]|nr:MAG: glyoxalase [Calditrichota bacterium]MBL1206218.1 glyoxalase [Calditrichota bacterium]NOG46044.1 glyoxalase [Calditrichota bacterium]